MLKLPLGSATTGATSPSAQDKLQQATQQAWGWLQQRAQRTDFPDLLQRVSANPLNSNDWEKEFKTLLTQLVDGKGLPSLHFELADNSTMQGLLGAYASEHPSGTATILVNESFFEAASEEQRLKLLLQEIGHAIDDRLNGPGADSRGDEGAFFASLVTAANPNTVDAAAFNYNDHYTLRLAGQKVAVEASTTAATFFRTTPDGQEIPAAASSVGGIVLQLVGLNGPSLFTQTAASTPYAGFLTPLPGKIGQTKGNNLTGPGHVR